MINNFENLICCPICKSKIQKNHNLNYFCDICKIEFNVYENIIDFRNPISDSTKGFSIRNDLYISKILSLNFSKFKTFNGLLAFYEKLREFKNIEDINYTKIDQSIKASLAFDIPMSTQQSIHGYDILKKINLYKNEFNYESFDYNVCLENGCGHGLFIEGLSKQFQTLLVIDFSMSYLFLAKKICEERKITNIKFLCASVENLPIKENSIDLIHSNNVIEHVSDQASMIKEINRALSFKGFLFLLSPNKNSAYFEPHYKIPFYGLVPFKIRHWLIFKFQKRDSLDVQPLSLLELKQILKDNFLGRLNITFLPSKLKQTAQTGLLRKIIIYFLNNKLIGSFFSFLLNKILLGIMPYHVVIAKKNEDKQ